MQGPKWLEIGQCVCVYLVSVGRSLATVWRRVDVSERCDAEIRHHSPADAYLLNSTYRAVFCDFTALLPPVGIYLR